jgi:hypothetical protein
MPTRMGFINFMPQAEESWGRALAVKITVWTGAHTLQGGVQGRQMDRFRHKSGLLPRPCEILLEESIWGFTPSQTDEFPFFHAHSASEDTAKSNSEAYVFP